MNWMHCTCCQRLVSTNNTGICMSCMMGRGNVPGEDAWKPEPPKPLSEAEKLMAEKARLEAELQSMEVPEDMGNRRRRRRK
jgi:hypothetical protein